MATRPSGLRQPSSAVRSSNTNLSSAGGTVGGSDVPSATPTKSGPTSALPTLMNRLPSSNSIRRKITTPGIQAPGSRDSGLAPDVDNFIIGDTVYVNGDPTKRGKICFLGEVTFAKGDFAGIVLDLPIGNHDGVVQGKRYFQCAPSHGLFTKLSRLTRDPILESPSTPRAPQSTASSVIMSPDPQTSSAGGAGAVERTPSPSGLRTPQRSMSIAMGSSLALGERVIVASATGGTKIGILRYLGTTEFAPGEWAGVELLTPMGKNNGTVGGKPYFSCKDKHGLFVPASKVISSPVNKTPRRHGSRESLISVSSLASSAASRSIRRPSVRDSQCLPTCSLQSVLAEKEKHMERLIKERELDRLDLANLSRQFEEKKLEVKKLHSDCSLYQQQIQSSSGDSEQVAKLQNALEEEHRKLEDLQYTLDEEKIMKADLQTQLDSLTSKLSESEIAHKSTELSRAELEKYNKEIEALKASLSQKEADSKKLLDDLAESQAKLLNNEKIISDLNSKIEVQASEIVKVKEDRNKLDSGNQEEIAVLKKVSADHLENVNKLKLQLDEKKRKEDEYKERQQKLLDEFDIVNKQKCALEAEVIDLVNSKSDASDLLSGKIKDLSEEIQDLRAKLQSTEEDKAVVRRINAEFKSRFLQQELAEAALKKELEAAKLKLGEEKAASEKQLTEQIATIQAASHKLEEVLKEKDEEIASLQKRASTAESSVKAASTSSEESVQVIEALRSEKTDLSQKLVETQEALKKMESEMSSLKECGQKKEAELNEKCNRLSSQTQKMSEELSTSVEDSISLKKQIDTLQAKVSQLMEADEEKSKKVSVYLEEINAFQKKAEEDESALEGVVNQVESLKKDKSILKEQLSSFKGEKSRFQEIEQALSQELAVLRNKVDQKNKAISDLEKELADKKADVESNKASMLDANSPQAHIDFLNSIIVDLQRKNEELNVKLNVLINGGVDADANSNRVAAGGSSSMKAFQSLRPYCDICEKFDLHDTEDCPAQVTEDNTHYGANRGESRPYCETCEIFGHVTGECDDQETY